MLHASQAPQYTNSKWSRSTKLRNGQNISKSTTYLKQHTHLRTVGITQLFSRELDEPRLGPGVDHVSAVEEGGKLEVGERSGARLMSATRRFVFVWFHASLVPNRKYLEIR